MESQTVLALVHIYLQTLALAVLFILSGKPLVRKLLPAWDRAWPLAFVWSSAYFLGLASFLASFVFVSRACGSARLALWLTLAGAGIVSLVELIMHRPSSTNWKGPLVLAASLVLLVACFSVTNATLWMFPSPDGELSPTPPVMRHFGSIHAGRYANYGIFIDQTDRVPYLAQNMGQSMLSSFHLLLGAKSPLAALMVWVPFTMSAFAGLLFGLLRSEQLSVCRSMAGAYFVLFCNIVLSLVCGLVLDNGSPLGFAGYTDVVASAATFLIFACWVRSFVAQRGASSPWLLALLGVYWSWMAPQNVLVSLAAAGALLLLLICSRRTPRWQLLRRAALSMTLFVAAVAAGGVQLGPFLPKALREEIGSRVFDVEPRVGLRPYLLCLWTHWTDPHWNRAEGPVKQYARTDVYRDAYDESLAKGRLAVGTRWLTLFEDGLWNGLRIFGYPLLGILLGGWMQRQARVSAEGQNVGARAWYLLSLISFVIGFGVTFLLELGEFKWWLLRFMVPGVTLGLVALALHVNQLASRPDAPVWRWAWIVCLLLGTLGPNIEFFRQFHRNWFVAARHDPIGHRLSLLVNTPGPYK